MNNFKIISDGSDITVLSDEYRIIRIHKTLKHVNFVGNWDDFYVKTDLLNYIIELMNK